MNKETEDFIKELINSRNKLTNYLNKVGNPDLTSKEMYFINEELNFTKIILKAYKNNN